jgi:predicted Zn-dependent protease
MAIAAVALGCETPVERHDPHARLAELLAEWRGIRETGRSCDERGPRETPLVDCERIQRAVVDLAIEFPRDPAILQANAVVAFEARRRAEAQMYLDSLLALQPVQPDAAVLRSQIAIQEGNLRYAERLLTEQIELRPDHELLRETLAAVLYLQGDLDGASASLDVAGRLGGPGWRLAYHRGLVAEAAGDASGAAQLYRESLELEPGFEPAASRLKGLAVDAPW